MLCGETWRARRSHILPVLLTPGPPMPHRVYPRPRPRTPLAVMMFLCCAVAALAGARADETAGGSGGVWRATLPNGLKVVIVRNTLAPVVATSVNYLVGSDEAPRGFPGTAHAEEHMMFRGSPGLTADQLADIGSIVGGNFNANTREGLTQYLFTVPSEDLDVALHIEALRLRAVLDSPEEWRRERGAIEQEVAQDLSEPGYVLFEKLRARMFAGTPYEHTPLGTRPSFEKTTARMLKSFHDTWYAPNNALLVIAGDVDPPTAAADPKALEHDARAILARVAREGVPPELVEAAKLQERSAAQFQRNNIAELASVWSEALALYGLASPDEDLERIERVTAADVNRVARRYLDLDHAVTGVMLPRGSGRPIVTHGGFGGQESISLGEAHPTALPSWAQKALERLEVPPSTLHPVVSTLPNGLTLIVQSEDVSDTVSVYGHIRNRPETEELKGEEGVAQVLEPLLTHGSEHLDRGAFQQALDAIGAREHAGTDFSVQALAEHFARAVELLADNEPHPALPPAAMEIIPGQVAQGVAARNASPGFLTQRSLRAALYPLDDPSLRSEERRVGTDGK